MTAPCTIRNMDWDDLPSLVGIDLSSQDPWNYQRLGAAMECPYSLGAVAMAEQQIAGFLMYSVSDTTPKSMRKQNRIHLIAGLVKLTVAPDWRKRGIATNLIQKVEDGLVVRFAQNHPAGRLTLTVTVPDTWKEAHHFLKKIGFAVPVADGHPEIKKAPFDFCDDDGYVFERRREWSPVVDILDVAGAAAA